MLVSRNAGQESSNALQTPVTVSARAEPLARVLDRVSNQIGVRIRTDPSVGERIVVVQAANVSAGELLTKLGSVTFTRIEKRGSEYRLASDSVALRSQSAKFEARRLEAIRNAQADAALQLQKSPKPGSDEEKAADANLARMISSHHTIISAASMRTYQQINGGGPMLVHLLSAIPTKELAAIEENQRVVYSNRPTAMQRQLPTSADGLTDAFVARFNERYHSLHNLAASTRINLGNFAWAGLDVYGRDAPLGGNDLKLIFAITRRYSLEPFKNMFTCQLIVTDDGGQKVGEATEVIGEPSRPKSSVESGEERIQLSPLAAEFGRAVEKFEDHESKFDAGPTLSAYVSQPDRRDPLSLTSAELVIGLAETRNKDLVAWLPDGCLGQLSSGQPQVAPSAVEEMIRNGNVIESSASRGWLEIRPQDPFQSERHFTHRLSLRNLADASQNRRPLPLRDVCDFLNENPSYEWADQIGSILTELTGGPDALLRFSIDPDWLRLIAHVSQREPNLLSTSDALPFSSLTPDEISKLSTLLYRAGGGATGLSFAAQSDNPETMQNMRRNRLALEPTEAFPDGLPMQGTITDHVATYQMLGIAKTEDRPKFAYQMLNNLSIGMQGQIFQTGVPRDEQETQEDQAVNDLKSKNFKWLEATELNQYSLQIRWSKWLQTTVRFNESVPLSKPVKTIDELPESLRTKLGGS